MGTSVAGLPDRGVVSRYLETLRSMRVLERRTPATERNPERTRCGRYRLSDPLFRFWFRFVLPNMSALEAGDPERVYTSKVEPHMDQHLSLAFEEIAAQHLWQLVREGTAPAAYDRVGGWWRGGDEVDVVGVSDTSDALPLGECTWSVRKVGVDVLEALTAKTQAIVADLSRPSGRFGMRCVHHRASRLTCTNRPRSRVCSCTIWTMSRAEP